MKRLPPRPFVGSLFSNCQGNLGKGGFTLVELLVCIGLLVLLIAMVTQLTSSTGLTVGNSGKHMDADTQARLIFNRMSIDITKMVKRTDLDYSSFKHPAGTYIPQSGTSTPASNVMPANDQTHGNDQMAFYAESDGYFSGTLVPSGSMKSTVSLVAYYVANDPNTKVPVKQPVLRRMGKGLGWETNGNAWANVAYYPYTLSNWYQQLNVLDLNGAYGTGHNLFDATERPSDTDYKTVGDQVFRFEYTYLLKSSTTQQARLSVTPWDTMANPSHTSINGFKDVAAIVVTLAVLDSTSRVIVKDYSRLADDSIFHDAKESSDTTNPTDGPDVATNWNNAIQRPDFAANAGIPKSAASAVRIYQRYFYLDTTQ